MMASLAIYMALFNTRPMGQARGDLLAGSFYVSNWFQIWVGQSYTAAENFAPLRHLWSLAVEEQFYLVWPLVMVVLLRKRGDRLPRVALWLLWASLFIAAVVAAMYVSGAVFIGADPLTNAPSCGPDESNGYTSVLGHCLNVNETLYLSTVTRAGGLMLGSAFALVWRPVAIMRGPLRARGRRMDVVGLLGLVGLALMMNRLYLFDPETGQYDPFLFRGGFLLAGICTIAVIAAATHRRAWIGRLLGVRPLHWVGTRSYGLYLYHWPIYQVLREPGQQLSLRQFLIALLIAVSFIVLLRPPVVLTLDPVGYRTRKDEGKWKDVQDVALADGMLTFADSAERTVSLPLNVIDVSRHTELVNEVYGRLNEAHGYRRFNPADFEQAD